MEVLKKDPTLGSSSSVFYLLLLPTLVLWYTYWRLSRAHLYKLAARLPGPRGLPIVGHLFDVIGPASCRFPLPVINSLNFPYFFPFLSFSLAAVFKTVIRKSTPFEHIAKMWIGPKLVVFIYDPRDVELLLSSHVYIDKASEYKFFKPWLGDGLLISTGECHLSSHCLCLSFLLLLRASLAVAALLSSACSANAI